MGAGTGATVGKLLGPEASCPGGVGSAAVRLPSGATVGALAVVNAVGDVHGRDGRVLAGARAPEGGFANAWRVLLESGRPLPPISAGNSTIAVVATDVGLDKAECGKLAERAHDGLALAIRPAHTMIDGDTVFALSVGEAEADPISLGVAAVEAMWRAIERAVTVD